MFVCLLLLVFKVCVPVCLSVTVCYAVCMNVSVCVCECVCVWCVYVCDLMLYEQSPEDTARHGAT